MPQLSLQVLCDPADFLLPVPVSVFFPGLSYHIGRVGCSHRHEAAARPVAHGSPDPFHQGTNVLLEKETQPRSLSVKPDTGKLKPSRARSAPAPELQEGHGRSQSLPAAPVLPSCAGSPASATDVTPCPSQHQLQHQDGSSQPLLCAQQIVFTNKSGAQESHRPK